jgi:hypothetical protein
VSNHDVDESCIVCMPNSVEMVCMILPGGGCRLPPQLAHLHSILPSHSRSSATRSDSIVFQNDGHPIPLSYFPDEKKRGEPQLAHMWNLSGPVVRFHLAHVRSMVGYLGTLVSNLN